MALILSIFSVSALCETVDAEVATNRILENSYIEKSFGTCVVSHVHSVLLQTSGNGISLNCLPEDLPSRIGLLKDFLSTSLLIGNHNEAYSYLKLLESEAKKLRPEARKAFSNSIAMTREILSNTKRIRSHKRRLKSRYEGEIEGLGVTIKNQYYSIDTGAFYGTKKLTVNEGKVKLSSFQAEMFDANYAIEDGLVFTENEEYVLGQQYLYQSEVINFKQPITAVTSKELFYWAGNIFFVAELQLASLKFEERIVCVDTGSSHSYIDDKAIFTAMEKVKALKSEEFVYIEIESSNRISSARAYRINVENSILKGQYYLIVQPEINRVCDVILGKDWASNNLVNLSLRNRFLEIAN